MYYLYNGLGSILNFIYNNIWPNYGAAIIIFTVFIKLLLLPIAIKQQKAMAGMQKIQPQLEEIRNKYKGDMTKMNEETMKLYAEHKVNPFGSCLPALVQLPIFIALYRVITQPLTYILNLSASQIAELKTQFHMPTGSEIQIAETAHKLSMHFLGLNLAQTPNIKEISVIILIPILAAATTYLSSKISMSASPQTADNPMQNSMMTVFPVMTLFFTFSFPAGLGLYWIISNLIQMAQQYFLNKHFKNAPKEVAAAK